MSRRILMLLAAVVLAAVSACTSHGGATTGSCTPPAGGRCAAAVAWSGPMALSSDGRRLHGVVPCGGTLTATQQTAGRVTVRLHVAAVGRGMMSCARVDVGVRLAEPLGARPVYDAVSGRRLAVTSPTG